VGGGGEGVMASLTVSAVVVTAVVVTAVVAAGVVSRMGVLAGGGEELAATELKDEGAASTVFAASAGGEELTTTLPAATVVAVSGRIGLFFGGEGVVAAVEFAAASATAVSTLQCAVVVVELLRGCFVRD